MHKHLILFFSALFLLDSCKQNKTSDNVIAKDRMVRVLSEVHIINGTLTQQGVKDSLYKYGTNRYKQLFKKYGIDSALFNKSLKYYSARPKDMMEIYDSVTVVLNFKNDSLSKIHAKAMEKETKDLEAKGKAEAKRKADSVRRDSINNLAKPVKLRLRQKTL